MARKNDTIQMFLSFPWWVNLFFAFALSVSPIFVDFYLKENPNLILERLNDKIIPYGLWCFALLFLFLSAFNLYRVTKRQFLFEGQNSIKDLYKISWSDFEYLVTEVFYRQGFSVKQSGGASADGGIDLEATKNGYKTIVQCKHWKKNSVGVSVVREMFAVGIHESAAHVFIVTCGYFTKDAKDFAKDKPMTLVNGYMLMDWIKNLKEQQ